MKTRPLSESHQYLVLATIFGVSGAICLLIGLSDGYSDDTRLVAILIAIFCASLFFTSLLSSWAMKIADNKSHDIRSSSGKTVRKNGNIHYKTDLDAEINQRNQSSEKLKEKKEEITQKE